MIEIPFADESAEEPAKVTVKNVRNYLSSIFRDIVYMPQHEKEQSMYRAKVAEKCTIKGSCVFCGCATPDMYLGTAGCKKPKNPCFPDMMNQEDWEKFKEQNKIEI